MKSLKIKDISNKSYLKFLLLLIVIIFENNKEVRNPTNITEFLYYQNQTLQLLVPKKECKYISPMTIYFQSEFSDYNIKNNYEIKKINLKNKNFFVSYYLNDFNNYPQFLPLLKNNGLIRSSDIMGENNLFFGSISLIPSDKNISKGSELNKYQKVGGYRRGRYFFLKNSLYKCYKHMKNLFHEDYNYMPETYIYPEDRELIENKFKNYHLNLNDLWLIKPVNACKGYGIFIFHSLNKIKMKEYIITRYISNINLINGRKYDLRLYVLISSLNPLRIYLYNEGLVRIAIEKFELGLNSVKNKYMHITNTGLNIKNEKFINPNNTNDENSNMWNLFMYKRFLRKNNIQWSDLLSKIKDIIIKSIISFNQQFIEENNQLNLKSINFYKIIGIDILIKKDFNPLLIEMNYYPEIYYHNNVDKQVKTKLFFDALNIIGIAPFSRNSHKPLNLNKKTNEKENIINMAYCELARPRGDFELIFPNKDNIKRYSKYFKNISFENKRLWQKLINK